jgi:hypothetical protein
MNRAPSHLAQLGLGRNQHIVPSSADVDRRAQIEESLRGGFPHSRASASNQNAFVLKKIVLEHGSPFVSAMIVANSPLSVRAGARHAFERLSIREEDCSEIFSLQATSQATRNP